MLNPFQKIFNWFCPYSLEKSPSAQFSSVMSDSLRPHRLQHTRLPYQVPPTPGTYSNSSIVLVMPSNHLILCHPLVLPPSIFPSIRVFFNESALRIRWPKYWISIVAILVCMPTNSVRGLPFLCTLSSIYCL